MADPGHEWFTEHWRGPSYDTAGRVTVLVAVLGSALWHLILLIPASNKERPFVRWHGRQALLLAGMRTAVPLTFGLAFGLSGQVYLAIPLLLAIWLSGTLWGQRQAAGGDCSLMLWSGQERLLSSPQRAWEAAEAQEPDADALVEIIHYSREPAERRKALSQLQKLGMVEPL